LFVLSSWLFVRGNVSNLMTTVIPMMLTPQALELSPTFARVEWISCNRNSIGRVRKPNHPFPASAAGAIASAPPDAAMAAASAMASESRSASVSEERTCWRESTCWRRRDDGSTNTAESLLLGFDDGDSGRREEDDAGGANAAAIGAEEAATINDTT